MDRTTTPVELALKLGVDPKVLRHWLRTEYPRGEHDRYQRWILDGEMQRRATEFFRRGSER